MEQEIMSNCEWAGNVNVNVDLLKIRKKLSLRLLP
jgi:hypothetical protein